MTDTENKSEKRDVWQTAKGLAAIALAVAFMIGLSRMFLAMLPDVTEMSATFSTQAAFLKRLSLPPGFQINLYAADLGRARGMVLTPKGDIIVASPGTELKLVKADSTGQGHTDGVETLMDNMRSPHGLLLDGDWLYIAETGRIIRIRYDAENGKVVGEREVMVDGLPTGDGYWSRSINKGPDGWFYVSIGASCDACIEDHPWRASMIRFRPGEEAEIYATGLRNTIGFDWHPITGDLYGVEMGRNRLGNDIPPDEVNVIVEDGFYGWPYVHGDDIADPDLGTQGAKRVSEAIKPVYNLPAHISPMAIRFLRHTKSPDLEGAALVSQHGSWNRRERVGFGILSLHWDDAGGISHKTFLTGFDSEGEVSGRPLDIIEADDGTLYFGDDFSGAIWRVTYQAPSS
jgi:glucose/arabinose dehydrogenase